MHLILLFFTNESTNALHDIIKNTSKKQIYTNHYYQWNNDVTGSWNYTILDVNMKPILYVLFGKSAKPLKARLWLETFFFFFLKKEKEGNKNEWNKKYLFSLSKPVFIMIHFEPHFHSSWDSCDLSALFLGFS